MSKKIVRHQDLEVYRKAFEAAMQIFEISKQFPKEEAYSLTDQVRRASRSVCSNIAEAWRKRRYEAAFISKLNDAEGEAAETQTWLEFAVRCEYLKPEVGRVLFRTYDEIISMLVSMINNPQTLGLTIRSKKSKTLTTISLSPSTLDLVLHPLFSSGPPVRCITSSGVPLARDT
jgi:four helix bundle protein